MRLKTRRRMIAGLVLCAVAGATTALVYHLTGKTGEPKAPAVPVAPGTVASSTASPVGNPGPGVAGFHQSIQPLLKTYCYDCHGNGTKNGNVAFDELASNDQILNPQLWLKVLKNVRAGVMPPPNEPRPTAQEQAKLTDWIKSSAFGSDPANLDPGRVTVRRLNRNEYRNSVRDLLGMDLDVNELLPPDDVGYGFDNIGDVLSISPMRLEKFMEAAIEVVDKAVPKDTVTMASITYLNKDIVSDDGRTSDAMSFYQVRTCKRTIHAPVEGDYNFHINIKIDGDTQFDPQECRIHVATDGNEFFTEKYVYSDVSWFDNDIKVHLGAGDHVLSFTTEPVHPELKPLRTRMDYRIIAVRFDGPLDRKEWKHPPGFSNLYTREEPPTDPTQRRAYAREVLNRFASRAFRRPVPADTLDRLVALAEKTYSIPNTPFETGIAQAIVAILTSPRFLFHLEGAEPVATGEKYPLLDEYSLAARLSYALWCSVPDEELTRLAAAGELRKNFGAQVKRMLADPKSQAFVSNFSQQWLQTRAILDIPINSADIMAQEGAARGASASPVINIPGDGATFPVLAGGAGGRGGRGGRGGGSVANFTGMELTPEVRKAMMGEVEAYFNYVVREDRSVLDFIQSNYTFVNAALAPVYGIPNISGMEMRKVTLPEGDLHGGVLTMGSVLTVTSNPGRTSPVKRGKWILENILGFPTAPPPPNVPALEDSLSKTPDKRPTQREVLAIHRESPMCASCHARMDPLGLAMENFNAFGRYRSQEFQQPIEPSGELITGEKFKGVVDLKQSLVKNHKLEFYRTLTSKLLVYVLGRGTEYYDVATIDAIAEQMDKQDGKFSALLMGVLESAPVQRCRPPVDSSSDSSNKGG
jgi:hypothetical protein